jgi:hypothetical protein
VNQQLVSRAVAAVLVFVGLVNFLPILGVLGPERLRTLYGVAFEDANVVLLMRHRAVLLGLVGGFVIASGFLPSLRTPAFILGLASMLSFIALAWMEKGFTAEIQKVVVIDVVASVAFAVAAVAHFAFLEKTR